MENCYLCVQISHNSIVTMKKNKKSEFFLTLVSDEKSGWLEKAKTRKATIQQEKQIKLRQHSKISKCNY